jgi:hypothetical protein
LKSEPTFYLAGTGIAGAHAAAQQFRTKGVVDVLQKMAGKA